MALFPRIKKKTSNPVINTIEAKFNEVVDTAETKFNEVVDTAEAKFNNSVDSFKNKAYNYIQSLQDGVIHKNQSHISENLDIPIEYREYVLATACDIIHEYAPDQTSPEFIQNSMAVVANMAAPMYNGKLEPENFLASGDKQMFQTPPMLSYWAKNKKCKVINPDNYKPNDNCVILTYYPPVAQSFFANGSEEDYDSNNRYIFSHCKSEFNCENGTKVVINPELNYNSVVPVSNNKTANVVDAKTMQGYIKDVQGHCDKAAINYVIDCNKLGLDKKNIETGFKLMAADINIMNPEIQKAVFTLQDNGYTTDQIINLYINNVDITNAENLKKLNNKNSNIDNLIKRLNDSQSLSTKDNSYYYNLQENNCAIKPMAALVFANECKIRNNNMDEKEAAKCRMDLGLPNIYDKKNYSYININFYNDYMDYTKLQFDKRLDTDIEKIFDYMKKCEFDKAAERGDQLLSLGLWGIAEVGDTGLENMQKLFDTGQKKSGEDIYKELVTKSNDQYNDEKVNQFYDWATYCQQRFTNKLKIYELQSSQKEEKVTPQNEDTPKNTYTMLDKNISYNINNQNNR